MEISNVRVWIYISLFHPRAEGHADPYFKPHDPFQPVAQRVLYLEAGGSKSSYPKPFRFRATSLKETYHRISGANIK